MIPKETLLNPEAVRVAHEILRELRARNGRSWLGSRGPGLAKPTPEQLELLLREPATLLKIYQLKNIGADSHAGLLGWMEQRYPLILLDRIPSPKEMLEVQCEGRRYVTHLTDPGRRHQAIGRHAGSLEFLLHDLEHAHKFFGEAELMRGQVRFFRLLCTHIDEFNGFAADPEFSTALDYLMADMNSHPIHLLKYLKAIVLNGSKRLGVPEEYEPFCGRLFGLWGLPPHLHEAALRINLPGHESEDDRRLLSDWFFSGSF